MPYFFEKKLVSLFFFCFFLGRVLTGEYQGNWGLRVFFFLYNGSDGCPHTHTHTKKKRQKKSREAVSSTSSDFFFVCVSAGAFVFFFPICVSCYVYERVSVCGCMGVYDGAYAGLSLSVCVCVRAGITLFSLFFS